jgi:hypothetical protein
MLHEGELFLRNTMWQGTIGDLLTSRRTWPNTMFSMAIYGVTPETTDADGFGPVDLPADRTGFLTIAPFLTSSSRNNGVGTSVVGRGIATLATIICSRPPVFPENDPDLIAEIANQEGWTEKRKADYRADPVTGSKCFGCHAEFDAMGLVVEHYDAVGRYRMADLAGNVIDTAWTTSKLPEAFDYDQNADGVSDPVIVTSPADLAAALLRPTTAFPAGALEPCMAMNLINFALADESLGSARAPAPEHPTNRCAVRGVTDQLATDKSFSALIREISASDTLALRTRGL